VRVLLTADHRYPAARFPAHGIGRASARQLDLLARGLSSLGHEVFYALAHGEEEPLPPGIVAATEQMAGEVDIVHHQRVTPYERADVGGTPWVRTIHTDLLAGGYDRARLQISEHWIYVSRALAKTFGSDRWVHNGIDPAEYLYSAKKGDDLLFVASLDRAWEKGLDLALDVADACGRRLIVAGSASTAEARGRVAAMCRGRNARLAGEISGSAKAELFARAGALLAPSRALEAFGLTCVEALVSGTPVVCSDRGGLPEVVTNEVGFVCSTREEMIAATGNIGTIRPEACREYALEHFHYLRMAERYVEEYRRTIGH
jgi:glycosyltransferase involved in cell wall biosynthesis